MKTAEKYISQAALLEHLDRCKQSEDATTLTAAVITALQCYIQSQPAADVVPVTRCRACIYRINGMCVRCGGRHMFSVGMDDFCSVGVRKDV